MKERLHGTQESGSFEIAALFIRQNGEEKSEAVQN